MKLTKASIARLTLPHGKRDVIFFDEDMPGFGVRIRAGGKQTWIAQYRVGAKQRRVTLGDVRKLDADKARTAARNRLAQVTLGGDPQADKITARTKAAVTVGAVVETYLTGKRTALRPKSFEETERYLRKYWRPLHGLPVHKIERRAVASRLAEIAAENGPIAATRARAALSAMLAWAIREGIAEENAVVGTNRPAEPKSRDRVLTNAELGQIWSACREDDYGRIVQLLILTGQRRDEIGAMAWSELDLARGTWCISGERTKNKRTHALTPPPFAWSIVAKVERRDGNDRLFGRGDGGFGGWSKAKAALDDRIRDARRCEAKSAQTQTDNVMPAWTVHDIRRSVATHMAELGVLPHIIEAVLNHVSGHKAGIAGVYNRSTYDREAKAALAIWAAHVYAIVEGGEPKVVAFPA